MDELVASEERFTISRAVLDDVPALVSLLTDDMLGQGREGADLSAYRAAFKEIDVDVNQFLASSATSTLLSWGRSS